MRNLVKSVWALGAATLLASIGLVMSYDWLVQEQLINREFRILSTVVALSLVNALILLVARSRSPQVEDTEDQTQRKDVQIRRQAYHDTLTRLPNRALFDETVRRIQENAPQRPVGVLLVNLDQFKTLNDSLGPKVGDKVLRAVSKRIRTALSRNDKVFRVGGDEFLVMMPDANDAQARVTAQRIIGKIRRTFSIDAMQVRLTSSVGMAMWPTDHSDFEQISRCADLAVRAAKKEGANQLGRYESTMLSETDSKLSLLAELPAALKRKEFRLVYQPRINARTGRVESFEALLRWQHPQKGLLAPDSFIRVLEDSPMIIEVGNWVLETACKQLMQWHANGHDDLSISVNVAARQFRHRKFVQSVQNALERSNANPAFVELEITESQLLGDLGTASRTVEDLKLLGLTISIDDFGTGYSSLAYLHKLPIDALKIDRTFVDGIGNGPLEGRIAQAITSLGHTLGLKVVAEGVETEAQAEQLRGWGCDQLQGYLFAKPAPAEEVQRLLVSSAAVQPTRSPREESMLEPVAQFA